MGANAHDLAGAIRAALAVLEEEVDAVAGPAVTAGAIPQLAAASLVPGQFAQQPVELIQMCLPACVHDSCSAIVPGG